MRLLCRFLCVAIAALAITVVAQAQDMQEGRLFRFPDVYKDKIVFSYAGDLWLVSTSGGIARRITTNPGLELFPKFSPDGSHIAFTGQYDGNPNVYTIPAEGGEPKQFTFETPAIVLPERMGMENEMINWMPDGKSILFLSRRETFNSGSAISSPYPSKAAFPPASPSTKAASRPSPPTAIKSPSIASSAISAPGSVTPAAWRREFPSTISRPTTTSKSTATIRAWTPSRCGAATPSTSPPIAAPITARISSPTAPNREQSASSRTTPNST